MPFPQDGFQLAQVTALFFLTFLSEDAATVSGAVLSAAGTLHTPLAFTACFLGIWLGDIGLFALARYYGRPILARNWVRRRVSAADMARSEGWMKKNGLKALIISRFVPGLRLPTYVTAGLLAMPTFFFAIVTGVVGLLWVSLVFALVIFFGNRAIAWLHLAHHYLAIIFWTILAIVLTASTLYYVAKKTQFHQGPIFQRWLQWEFWPGWLFYPPVGLFYLYLGIKYGGFNLPMVANPGMLTGGLVGESKYETLRDLYDTSPEFTARTALITSGDAKGRVAELRKLMGLHQFDWPVVLKPNVAQRGSGFKLARSVEQAENYLREVRGEIILQEYLPGPLEAGIFYYRFPQEKCGKIFAITDKIFPAITGDGKRTVEQLIRSDKRAQIIAQTYLLRHETLRDKVLPAGEILKLVEAGNHAQGCIFRDGKHLWSEALEARIDEISQKTKHFYIGRYDVRYSSEMDLRVGINFKILELNGAASEATSIYDNRNSLRQAYATLYQQWELVFAIGAANRKLGHKPDALISLWHEWRKYQKRSLSYPPAD